MSEEVINENNARPFFSVIIPCYNSNVKRFEKLLESIVNQNMKDDIEVIISDDRSSEKSYLDTVDDYKSKLNIKITTVDYVDVNTGEEFIHCPGNTREFGVQQATGEQITFIDHDDEFIPDTFKQIKEIIINEKVQYIASCDFYEINPYNNEILNEFKHTGNQMHGKFYNLDNFQKAKDFHFKRNLQTHEDIYISSKTICELQRLGLVSPYYIDLFCMKQMAWGDSTSRQIYNQRGFLETFFNDYCTSTIDYYINDFIYSINKLKDNSDENIYNHLRLCIDVIIHMYFYIQGFHFQRPKDYILQNDLIAKSYIRAVCEIFNTDINFIYACVLEDGGTWYNNVRKSARVGSGDIIEQITFYEFLK